MAIEAQYNDTLISAREVFGRRRFHQASTQELARAASLSLAGLYHSVGGKDGLLFLTLDHALDVLHGVPLHRARWRRRIRRIREPCAGMRSGGG